MIQKDRDCYDYCLPPPLIQNGRDCFYVRALSGSARIPSSPDNGDTAPIVYVGAGTVPEGYWTMRDRCPAA
jgi:hypothetical protein